MAYEEDDQFAVIITAPPRRENDDHLYCRHGSYVGGSGADLMCHWCEGGYSDDEVRRAAAERETAWHREQQSRIMSATLSAFFTFATEQLGDWRLACSTDDPWLEAQWAEFGRLAASIHGGAK